ncbi:hypothetical protein BJ138DRAFT_1107585 [Hygrophoropsis aurantiaca]|uniref:Uncharacterized protein n=1 Tax=Hygrophoropsis aurantiaca TaxID=72124 RepID=A0ACB7ZS84_9AGAM|nr:hypothetical protein BJ138DRAFT_1107585 [Hygrophoropsis aurantiaca]
MVSSLLRWCSPSSCGFPKRRRKGTDDPPRQHPATVFVDNDEVIAMEEQVNSLQSVPPHRGHRPTVEEVDEIEPGMHVPNSVLDECGDSFKAADKKRKKASTQFFSDTGLMAMLCRHDPVLWLVNMTSAGERQHYSLALIEKLITNLPPNMIIGTLYDIACQLHCSCVKWGFLDHSMHRITFATAVFHAYAHNWACQLIYHPRKCIGFGLSDGEGCKRLWSDLKILIPSLRISGFHQRLFSLDCRIKYLDEKSLCQLGHWLRRHWDSCQGRMTGATRKLDGCDIDNLRHEWQAQVIAQTKPPPRRSQNKGKDAAEAVIALQLTVTAHEDMINKLEDELEEAGIADTILISEKLEKARAKLAKFQATLQRQKKLHSHTESSLKRREPAILNLVKNYNDLSIQISSLVRNRKAPQDVDDDMWQDIGLEDDLDDSVLPGWLSDEKIRQGIKDMLELDRCKEEEQRLMRERCAMQEWAREEWACVENARALPDDAPEVMAYHLGLQSQFLCRIFSIWGHEMWHLQIFLMMMEALANEYQGRWETEESDRASTSSSEVESMNDVDEGDVEVDAEFLDLVEDMALGDQYAGREGVSDDEGECEGVIEFEALPSSPVKAVKRPRCKMSLWAIVHCPWVIMHGPWVMVHVSLGNSALPMGNSACPTGNSALPMGNSTCPMGNSACPSGQ